MDPAWHQMSGKKLNVIIVGGSICGLFAGIVFKRQGHSVRILERNPTATLHDQGAGLVSDDDLEAFMRKHDKTHSALFVTSTSRHYLGPDGSILEESDRSQKMTSWDLLYFILRANYDGLKSNYCMQPPQKEANDGSATYEYGCAVLDVKEIDSSSVEVTFNDPSGNQQRSQCDLVIGADGASSTVRGIHLANVTRDYVGYVAWRGTVGESQLSPTAQDLFLEHTVFFQGDDTQVVAYTIPGLNGSLEPGQRLANWVWYCNYPLDSAEHTRLMTSAGGYRHRLTVPAGKVQPEVWTEQRAQARATLPLQLAEIINQTDKPFVQCITDVISPCNSFLAGKVLLTGDALAGFRPHTGASTNQAAFDVLKLEQVLTGQLDLESWQRYTMDYARDLQRIGVRLGQQSQFGKDSSS